MIAQAKQRILVVGPSNIGDGILIMDVIARLRSHFPEAHLGLVVGSRAAMLFENDPRIQTLMAADRYDSFLGRLRLAASLWRYQPDVLVDLRHTLYPLLLKPLSFWRYLRNPPKNLHHMRDRHLWKLKSQVPQIDAADLRQPQSALWWTDKDAAAMKTLRQRWEIQQGAAYAVICPGARSHIKRWTAEGFAQVADQLIKECSLQVIFSGEPEEKQVIEDIRQLMAQKAFTSVGQTTLRQLGVLMSEAALVITNDSASLHLASMVQAPTLAIFGPTDAQKYGPFARRSRVIQRQLFCSPCEVALCRYSHECMRFIQPDEVFVAAKQLLGNNGRKHA